MESSFTSQRNCGGQQQQQQLQDNSVGYGNEENIMEQRNFRKKIPVVDADLRVALSAIENNNDRTFSDNDDRKDVSKAFIMDAKRSIVSQIKEMVDPLPFEEYKSRHLPHYDLFLQRRCQQQLDDDELSSSDVDTTSSEESVESSPSYDEDLLLDQEAVSRVKELRENIRNSANELSILQSSFLQKLLSQAKEQMTQMQLQLEEQLTNEDTKKDDKTNCDTKDNNNMQRIDQTVLSLEKLLVTLKSIDTKMPTKIDHLQETIDTVEDALSKKQQQNNSIDAAISSRDNEGPQQSRKAVISSLDEDDQNDTAVSEMNSEERFAMFMSREKN